MEGWIKVHRKILDNPIVCKDSETFSIWLYLLLNATHQEYDVLFKGERITLKEGQLLTGILSIAKKLKIDKNKVQRTLKIFENEKQIEQQTSNRNRLISIVEWDKYQESDKQIEKQVINKRETTDKQVITNKNVKNIKNKKNINNIYAQNRADLERVDTENWEKSFDQFYSQYPRKVAKQKVKEWFKKNKPNSELLSLILSQLEQFKGTEEWKKDHGQFIPYPITWLNQRRWEDETIGNQNTKTDLSQYKAVSADDLTQEEYSKLIKGSK